MRHADHGDVLLRELDHNVQNLLDHLGVECRGRLVKQDDGLLGAQGAGDGDTLLLTAREVLRILTGLMCHTDALERGDGDLGRLLLALLLQLDGRERQVAEHRHVGVQVELLKHHGAVLASHLQVILLGKRRAVDNDLARRGLLKIIDAADERRLTRTGRPDHYELLAALDGEVDIFEHMQVAKVLVEMLDLDHVCHECPFPALIRIALLYGKNHVSAVHAASP